MGTKIRSKGRRKMAVFALGAVGLAGALTISAFVAPNHTATAAPIYTPTDATQIITRVPPRDPNERATRQALAAAPDRVELAVELARADIGRYRALSDPRYLGRAQATLARWWKLAEPPSDVQLLRATIEQSLHEFPAARADLDHVIAQHPEDAQAQLTRAVVATVTGDYAAARASCASVAKLTSPLIAATCEAPLDGIAGHADQAYDRLASALQRSHGADPGVRGWAMTALAELAIQRGDYDAASLHLRTALALDDSDAYARAALADVLLETGRPADASTLLAGHESIDSHLVRRAIAESIAGDSDATTVIAMMRDRIAAAADRGDRIHLREEARFTLAVDHDAARATKIAIDNWAVQKELADARLLAECAAAADDRQSAAPVIEWARATGVRDAQLDRWLGKLGGKS